MKRTLAASLILILFSNFVFADDLSELVQNNVSLVVSLVENNQEMSIDALQPEVDGILADLIDYESISMGVMGKHKQEATQVQRVLFQETFRYSLSALFIKSFRELEPKNIEIADVKIKENKARVKVNFSSGNNVIVELLFSLRKIEASWKVVNFLVDGINMGLAYRNLFDSKVKEYSEVETVISRWQIDVGS